MQKGNKVRVYPHGYPEDAADGTVLIVAAAKDGKRTMAAIKFHTFPPFVRGKEPYRAMRAHPITMLAYKYHIGPWIEFTGGGHYEIEECA